MHRETRAQLSLEQHLFMYTNLEVCQSFLLCTLDFLAFSAVMPRTHQHVPDMESLTPRIEVPIFTLYQKSHSHNPERPSSTPAHLNPMTPYVTHTASAHPTHPHPHYSHIRYNTDAPTCSNAFHAAK